MSEKRTSPLFRGRSVGINGEQVSKFIDTRIIRTAKLYSKRVKMESMRTCAAHNISLMMHLTTNTVEMKRAE